MSKRIVRLSESQLRDMIKRVINEQSAGGVTGGFVKSTQQSVSNDPDYKTAWGIMNQIMASIQGAGTEEDDLLTAIQQIKTQKIYNYLLQIIQKSPTVKQKTGRNYSLVMEYIMEDFQIPIVDKPSHSSRHFMPGNGGQVEVKPSTSRMGYGAGGYGNDKDTQTAKSIALILGKFNQDEYEPFSRGTDEESV